MTPPPKCINPFKKKGHSCYRKHLTFLSENYDSRFSELYGSYVCVTCLRQLYKTKNVVRFDTTNDTTKKQSEGAIVEKEKEDESELDEEFDFEKKDNDCNYVCKAIDDKCKRLKVAAAIEEIITASPAKKCKLVL